MCIRDRNDGLDGSPKVDQVLDEIEQIDSWKRKDINWLEELYQYSQRALTPDDSIVDSFDAAANTRDEDTPRVIVKTRLSKVQKESNLIGSLKGRPFVVSTGRSGFSEADKTYPIESTLNVDLVVDDFEGLKLIDAMADEFIKARNAKLMKLSSETADPIDPIN